MDHLEGYCDGLAGAGMQDRDDALILATDTEANLLYYDRGFILGSLDRKEMLKNNS